MSNPDKPVSEAMDKAIKRLAQLALFEMEGYSCILVYKEYAEAEDVFKNPLYVKVSAEEITSAAMCPEKGT